MLSLRFINLIFDEVRNVALGIISRRIAWKHLTLLEKIDVFVMYVRRIFKNIFSHAEQISQAMIVRGFRGDSKTHKIHFPHRPFAMPDFVSILALCGVIGATKLSGCFLAWWIARSTNNEGEMCSSYVFVECKCLISFPQRPLTRGNHGWLEKNFMKKIVSSVDFLVVNFLYNNGVFVFCELGTENVNFNPKLWIFIFVLCHWKYIEESDTGLFCYYFITIREGENWMGVV